ncbi:MAG: carboxypeptidase-like regulatory domain-containing protein, partial [Bacteroidetes bacterium]|nr:carboxypeptidase-like regulatory domain-containing protein [Bacteroidota bacterium]
MSAKAQNVSVSGHITHAKTGEDLIGASVIVKSDPSIGAVSNIYGFYSLSLKPGTYTLLYQYIGLLPQEKSLTITESQTVDIELQPTDNDLQGVVIESKRENANLTETNIGTTELSVEDT